MLEDIIVTFIYGIVVLFVLILVSTIVFATAHDPLIMLVAIGILAFTYALGWCLKNYEEFKFLFKGQTSGTVHAVRNYKHPILNGLARLEDKYSISTLTFMAHVKDGYHVKSMDNLDYIEWLGLVNELPSIREGE